MNTSFFAKQDRWNNRLLRLDNGSGVIRAKQISQYLGAKLNPTEGYDDDICIYVKPKKETKFVKRSYIDIMDVPIFIFKELAKLKIPIIVSSLSAYDFYTKLLKGNKIIFIPQHNCNFERTKRDRKNVTTVGIIGYSGAFNYPVERIRQRLKKIGLELYYEQTLVNRQNVVDAYKKIDIQIVWAKEPWVTKNAMKLYNAASFGIPTIALRNVIYKEFEGYYIPVDRIDQMIKELIKFKEDKDYYAKFSEEIVPKAETYHISNIAKLYKKLN